MELFGIVVGMMLDLRLVNIRSYIELEGIANRIAGLEDDWAFLRMVDRHMGYLVDRIVEDIDLHINCVVVDCNYQDN